MRTVSLQSGSNGNCYYVEAGGVRLLFDAGISGRRAMERLAAHGVSIRDVDALIISHDHVDHVRHAGAFHRLFHVPVYLNRATHRVVRGQLGEIRDLQFFVSGRTLEFGSVRVETIPTPHDAADGVAFVVEYEGRRLGIFSDLGHPFPRLREALATCHAAYVESNYDPVMLAEGAYPADLKARIRGDGGHISNEEAAALVAERPGRPMEWVALAHLSEENNHPEVALRTHRRVLGERYRLTVARRDGVSEMLRVDG
ncbi:MAG: MBL fold metallo-hydrolase [Phycisphaerales bacterium]|nr:MBL fold metallo-hydrolase [Phycisphaerales bacterium]